MRFSTPPHRSSSASTLTPQELPLFVAPLLCWCQRSAAREEKRVGGRIPRPDRHAWNGYERGWARRCSIDRSQRSALVQVVTCARIACSFGSRR